MAVFTVNRNRSKRKALRTINLHQNKFSKGYISTINNSRRPTDSLSDLTNIEVVQDNVLRPRPPLQRYGTQPTLPVLGRGKIRQSGARKLLWMLNDGGTGKLYTQADGGAFTLVGGSYDVTAEWASCVQSKGKAYVFNGVDNLSYVNITAGTVHTYTALASPTAPTCTYAGTAGAETHYYKITANNAVGESMGGASGNDNLGKPRDSWIENTDYIDVSWSSVVGATSYTVYYSGDNITFYELYSTTATSWRDLGTYAPNTFKLAPEGNSTEGAVFKWMYVDRKNSQIFGITDNNYLYYSAAGTGDFSPYNGGGYVPIDEDGDTELNFVDGFRNGKGDPVITISARGAAGTGALYHVTFSSLTIGDQVIIYPDVYQANGQAGTYSARGVIKDNDSLTYPTGIDFKSTGTSQNIMNILTTNTISQVLERDLPLINSQYLYKSVGVSHKGIYYWALPVSDTENSEIWYMDTTRKNLWVLRWTVAAKDLWLYEDSTGTTHFCALVDNKVLEFTRAGLQSHQDDGVAWQSRIAFESLVWDEDGIVLGKIRNQYYKLLDPRGDVTARATGIDRFGAQQFSGQDTFTTTTTYTGIGVWMYSDGHQYGEDPGEISSFGKSIAVLTVRPKGSLAQLDWEVVANTSGTDYILSAVNTRGRALDEQIIKTGA